MLPDWKLPLMVKFTGLAQRFAHGPLAEPLTITCAVSLADSAPSLPASCSTYVPAVENVAVVTLALAFANVTVPGPLTFVQVVVTTPGGFGSPSSVTVPFRLALAG